jgi:hypothetical protein
MQIIKAERKQSKIKLAISGASGSGKTYSALQLAYGLCGSWEKVCLIDSENFSASLYSNLGSFNIINLEFPFSPERYIQAIKLAEDGGMEVIIIDSITQEWTGKGGCLEQHEKETSRMKIPNSFSAWASITPRHQAFIDSIIYCPCYIIATIRSKVEYAMIERNGKAFPQKVGLAPVTRENFEYDVSVHFELDQEHRAFCSKDRTFLFANQDPFIISSDTGKLLLKWCESGSPVNVDDVSVRIGDCNSIKELLDLYQRHPEFKEVLKPEFEQRKRSILINREVITTLTNQKIIQNGTD